MTLSVDSLTAAPSTAEDVVSAKFFAVDEQLHNIAVVKPIIVITFLLKNLFIIIFLLFNFNFFPLPRLHREAMSGGKTRLSVFPPGRSRKILIFSVAEN